MQEQALWTWQDQTTLSSSVFDDKKLYLRSKRFLDVLVSSILLIFLFPLLVIVAIMIKLDSPGPALFKQDRMGLRKRSRRKGRGFEIGIFTCYKFRTMYHNTDQSPHREYIKAFARDQIQSDTESSETVLLFKLADDSRVTRVGKMLRKMSLDELPQLLNVLMGEMSLVGPRPVPLYEVNEYKEWHKERFATPSGITGLWQVKGRSSVPFEEMISMDIEYVRSRSLWLDLKLLLLTIPSVLSGKGAV